MDFNFFDWGGDNGSVADMGGGGVLAAKDSNISTIPYLDVPLFSPATMAPDGQTLINDRSDTSFWNFDQSKITSGIQDVLGSVIQAGAKSGVQLASDSINRGTQNQNPLLAGMFRNFQSTQTGAQIQAASLATRAQNFLYNPMVWLGLVGAVILFFLARK